MTEEMRIQHEAKKRRLNEEAKKYKEKLEQRRELAKQNISTRKYPDRMVAAMNTKGNSVCPVCDFPYSKSSNPQRDLNWHVVTYNKC